MSASIRHQVDCALETISWSPVEIKRYQQAMNVISVKKSMRPGGDPTKPLPVILSVGTRRSYYDAAGLFFALAKEHTGERLLANMMTTTVIQKTFDRYYYAAAPGTLKKLLAAIQKVYLGCKKIGWVKGENPITPELRMHIKTFRDDYNVRRPRYGYQPEDARRIVQYLTEHNSAFTLSAELALRCGLRLSEIAGLKGSDVDKAKGVVRVVGKGGRYREVPLPPDLAEKLNTSMQYLFTPSRSWKSAFYRAVVDACRALDIKLTGVHRLRSNFAQNLVQNMQKQGHSEDLARGEASRQLGHNRLEVTRAYAP